MIPSRTVRLEQFDSTALDRQSFQNGDIVYDYSNQCLRLMDGKTIGGKKIATQVWANTAISTAVNSSASTLTSAIALKAPKADPTFTGTVTGTFSGPLTGNVTGNVSGTSGSTTGNAATATKLTTARNINSVAFDGSANISLSTLVNGSKTVSLESDGGLRLGNGSGQLYASSTDNAVYLSDSGYNTAPNANIRVGGSSSIFNISFGPGATKIWTFGYNGTLTAAGNITTTTGTVTASAVTTTNDVTVGGNVNISTTPTAITHATNKRYVDAKAIAIAVAMS